MSQAQIDIVDKHGVRQRLQVEMAPESLQRLTDIKAKLGFSSNADVIRNALRIYEWLVTEVDPDSYIEVRDGNDKLLFRMTARTLRA